MTAVVILASLISSYQRTRDPLSPLVIFSPMLFYVYVFHTYIVISHPQFSSFLPHTPDVEFVLLVNLLSILGFCLGVCHYRRGANDQQRFQILELETSPAVRRRFFQLGILLGTMASAAFWYMIFTAGGPVKLFLQAKPYFGRHSGYIGEMPMLTFPALFLLAAAWQGRRFTFPRLLIAFCVASTQIAQSVIGRRRGTIFLTAAVLAAFWYVVKNKKPNWKAIIGGTCALGMVLLYVAANRSANALTSISDGNTERFANVLNVSTLTAGDEFISASGIILTSNRFQNHHWGKRIFVTLFIRPIPSFLWEKKWEFFGLEGLKYQPGGGGMKRTEWLEAVGFNTTAGSATGFAADAFLEWSWGGVIACYLLGRGFGWLWKKWVSQGGVWTVVYAESMILSIFLPSQSLGAWLYRFLLLSIPTVLIFRIIGANKRRTVAPRNQPPIPMQSF